MKKRKGVVRMTIGEDLEVENILEYAKKELLGNLFRVKIVKSTLNHWLQECWEPLRDYNPTFLYYDLRVVEFQT